MLRLTYKGKKYYLVRKELVIGMMLLAAVTSIGSLCGLLGKAETRQPAEKSAESAYREPETAVSKLIDKDGCYLCGNAEKSLMGYFRQFDDLGIISLNQWYVLDMGILPHEGEEEFASGGTRTAMTGTGEGGDFFYSSQIPSRGISNVEISYGEDSIFDVDRVREILCQKCLDKLLEVMDTYEGEPRDLCLVDFQTLELYSLQGHYRSHYIRDYYVRLDETEDGLEVEAVYAPERE